ncbi:transposase [Gracilimonas sp.]|uniref:transposase n=1 Tax=Gracilimonas sp. TaxID=1974203 RepID=UPI003BAA4CF7
MSEVSIPFLSENTYHIWTHANGDDNFFRCEDNYRYFLKKYKHHVHPVVDTFAYCLMPNHFHFMVRIKKEVDVLDFVRDKKSNRTLQGFETLGGFSKVISQQFSNLFNAYTQAYNKKYSRKGSLFMSNFKRKIIHSDDYFVRLIAYIHNNPVHHGFTDDMNDWPFSSWHAYVTEKSTAIRKDEALKWFGDIENLRAIHRKCNHEKSELLLEGSRIA